EGTKLSAKGAARLQSSDEAETSSGTVWYEADVQIDRDRRLVALTTVHVPKLQLTGLPPARLERMATNLAKFVNRWQLKLSLDDVLASARAAKERSGPPPKLSTDTPNIVIATA